MRLALALSLPMGAYRSTLVTMTYLVVCFSILVQGLTVQPVVQRVLARSMRPSAPRPASASVGHSAEGGASM
jgi:NhaP-type Na+/H+ or K+/H+ antiporter